MEILIFEAASLSSSRALLLSPSNLKIPAEVLRRFAPGTNQTGQTNPGIKFGKSLSEFREVYDKDYIIPRRIRAGLKSLGNGWEYEVEFARKIGVRIADLANYREMFTEYVVSLNQASKRVWAGNKTLAEQLKEMV